MGFVRQRLRILVPTALGMVVVFNALPVSAHYVYRSGWTKAGPAIDGACVWNRSEISHGSGGGYRKAQTAIQSAAAVFCADDTSALMSRPNYIEGWLLRNGASCRHYVSTVVTSKTRTVALDYGTTPPCGGGDYNHRADSWVKLGGSWYRANYHYSGEHFFSGSGGGGSW